MQSFSASRDRKIVQRILCRPCRWETRTVALSLCLAGSYLLGWKQRQQMSLVELCVWLSCLEPAQLIPPFSLQLQPVPEKGAGTRCCAQIPLLSPSCGGLAMPGPSPLSSTCKHPRVSREGRVALPLSAASPAACAPSGWCAEMGPGQAGAGGRGRL